MLHRYRFLYLNPIPLTNRAQTGAAGLNILEYSISYVLLPVILGHYIVALWHLTVCSVYQGTLLVSSRQSVSPSL